LSLSFASDQEVFCNVLGRSFAMYPFSRSPSNFGGGDAAKERGRGDERKPDDVVMRKAFDHNLLFGMLFA